MSTMDDIAAERQRIADRLARIDAERDRLAQQLAELDATERVLSRMPQAGAARRGRRGRTAETTASTAAARGRGGGRARTRAASEAAPTAPSRRGRRARRVEVTTAVPARGRGVGRGGQKTRAKPTIALGDATLRAVEALGTNTSAEQVREYLSREFGLQVRPNHLGMALQRHRRAGRLSESDGRWSMVQTANGASAAG
jgi:hypothetical protein